MRNCEPHHGVLHDGVQGVEDRACAVGLAAQFSIRPAIQRAVKFSGEVANIVDRSPILGTGLNLIAFQHVVDCVFAGLDGFEVDIHLLHQGPEPKKRQGGFELQSFLVEPLEDFGDPIGGMTCPAGVLLAVAPDDDIEIAGRFSFAGIMGTVIPDDGIHQQVLSGVACVGDHAVNPLRMRHRARAGTRAAGVLELDTEFAAGTIIRVARYLQRRQMV